jgi:hypothetical protein
MNNVVETAKKAFKSRTCFDVVNSGAKVLLIDKETK